MTAKNSSVTLITAPFILSYPKLLNPEPYMENGKPKGDPNYSFEGIADIDSLDNWRIENTETGEFDTGNVERRLIQLAKQAWGDDFNTAEAVKHGGLAYPFKSGDKKADDKGGSADHYRGKKFFRAKALAVINGSPNAPTLYKEDNGLVKIQRGVPQSEQLISELFYGGAIVTAELNAVAGKTGEGRYLTFYLNSIVFERHGDRLGNGGSRIERLRGVRGGKTDYDATQGMEEKLDDEIPY